MTWGEILTSQEVAYCEHVLTVLKDVEWAKPLVNKVHEVGFSYATKPLLFELRFAAEIHSLGLSATYEAQLDGVSGTVDFVLRDGDTTWAIELVSIQVSDAVKRATVRDGLFFETTLSSTSPDPGASDRPGSSEGPIVLGAVKVLHPCRPRPRYRLARRFILEKSSPKLLET